jgi:hypothetical protein
MWRTYTLLQHCAQLTKCGHSTRKLCAAHDLAPWPPHKLYTSCCWTFPSHVSNYTPLVYCSIQQQNVLQAWSLICCDMPGNRNGPQMMIILLLKLQYTAKETFNLLRVVYEDTRVTESTFIKWFKGITRRCYNFGYLLFNSNTSLVELHLLGLIL